MSSRKLFLILVLVCASWGAHADGPQTQLDAVAKQCEDHGYSPGGAMFMACYQAGYERRVAVLNQALLMADAKGSIVRKAPEIEYGYFMPDGQPVLCMLNSGGVTTGCTKNLQLAWP